MSDKAMKNKKAKVGGRKLSKSLQNALKFILCFLLAMAFYRAYEGWEFHKCFGFVLTTITTVGYGYTYPSDDNSRIFTIFLMLFGVNFLFSIVVEFLSEQMNAMHLYVKKEFSAANLDINEIHRSRKRTIAIYFTALLLTILIGGVVFMELEGWSFISAVYFSVETVTTIGYGDLKVTGKYTELFSAFYIIFSVILFSFIVQNVQKIKAECKQLDRIEHVLVQRTNLDFLCEINNGKGITESQFVLAILEHLGTIDAERDVKPWLDKFKEYDTNNKGTLDLGELEILASRESVAARSQLQILEDNTVTRRGSLFDMNDLWLPNNNSSNNNSNNHNRAFRPSVSLYGGGPLQAATVGSATSSTGITTTIQRNGAPAAAGSGVTSDMGTGTGLPDSRDSVSSTASTPRSSHFGSIVAVTAPFSGFAGGGGGGSGNSSAISNPLVRQSIAESEKIMHDAL